MAAANPYRIRKQNKNEGIIHPSRSTILSHLVHPIPHNLIDYVWDYGSLPLETEKAYIRGMVRSKTEFSSARIVNLFVECVSLGQQSVRTLEGGDASSVSLRDLQRTIRFFGFFVKFLQSRKKPYSDLIEEQGPFSYWKYAANPLLDADEVRARAVLLTITVCYLFRLCNKASRQALISGCVPFFQKAMKSEAFDEQWVRRAIEDEKDDIIYRIRGMGLLPPEIAINCALKENVFTMLACLLNKIPLIICGKPGSSKTQAFKILKSTLKGVSSEETLFSELPEINELYYQGTLQSTSHGVKRLFERAKQNAEDNEFNNILTVFFFDEIGLAEISPNNPLKVLHDLLEEEDLNVAFLGISNWTLDASKMNRAVYLARWDLDYDDLLEICRHYQKQLDLERYSPRMRALLEKTPDLLAKAYLGFRRHQEEHFGHKNFHGSRDFYSLIKLFFRELSEKTSVDQVLALLKRGFDRNFSGGFDRRGRASESIIKELFLEGVEAHFGSGPVDAENAEFDLVEDDMLRVDRELFLEGSDKLGQVAQALSDKDSRFLLVFVDSNYVERIIIQKVQSSESKVSVLQGSNFDYDLKNQSLSADLLKELKFFVENGHTLVIKVRSRLRANPRIWSRSTGPCTTCSTKITWKSRTSGIAELRSRATRSR